MIGAKLICENKWGLNNIKIPNNVNNDDMPKGGEKQGVDSNGGSGVWNMEQNNPNYFMEELNKQGLPYKVVEIVDDKLIVLEDNIN